MTDFNSLHNRAVWFEIPEADLERSMAVYRAVLAIDIVLQDLGEVRFGLLEHHDGNGGCLVPAAGEIVQPIHQIGDHGYKALFIDCEGNRIALHSNTDKSSR